MCFAESLCWRKLKTELPLALTAVSSDSLVIFLPLSLWTNPLMELLLPRAVCTLFATLSHQKYSSFSNSWFKFVSFLDKQNYSDNIFSFIFYAANFLLSINNCCTNFCSVAFLCPFNPRQLHRWLLSPSLAVLQVFFC